MSNIDKRALRESAEKATKGQWVVEFDDEIYATDGVNNEQIAMVFSENGARDAAFIAAASPETVLALLDDLEAAEKRNVELSMLLEGADAIQTDYAEALECQDDNDSVLAAIVALKQRAESAEKHIAELEARNASTNFPGGFSIEEARTLHTNLVSSHISKAMSGEKMNKARKEADLRWIHSVLVSAAWFVKASIEAAGIGKGE